MLRVFRDILQSGLVLFIFQKVVKGLKNHIVTIYTTNNRHKKRKC